MFVLDAGQGVAGPYCGMLLAACGADVVKLEPPAGDWSRGLGSREGTDSVLHATYNRGKRSVVLDLREEPGRAAARALAARADVLIESFRPGIARRLGLGPEAASPGAVCVSISGFGQEGPFAERPCTDSVIQAFAGMIALNQGADGVPHKMPVVLSDIVTGLHAFIAVQAALAERARDAAPRRRVLDISLMGGTAALLAYPIAEAARQGGMPSPLNVPAGCYRGACGGWLSVALVREPEFAALAAVLGRPDLPAEPRFASFAERAAHRDALLPILRDAFAGATVAEWLPRLHAARLLAERVNTPLDWLAEPQTHAAGTMRTVAQPALGALPFPGLPGLGDALAPAPRLGEHTEAVLAMLHAEAGAAD
nr:CoA transferase [Roseomonas acroporae]